MEGLIQTLILVCLIVVILLLAVEKVKFIRPERKKYHEVKKDNIPDVIGKVITPVKEKTPVWLANRKKLIEQMIANKEDKVNNDSIENEQQVEKIINTNINELDEEDNVPPDDDRFVQAVSVNELTKVGNLLQQDTLNISQEKETTEIIQKIEGTEFFTMMQQSIEGASEKIARLLDKSLLEKHTNIPKEDQNNVLDNFDIGDFT
jgi:hypothetical protein